VVHHQGREGGGSEARRGAAVSLNSLLAGPAQPVRGFEASHLLEVLGVVGDKHEVERHCVRGNQGIQRSDGGALKLECGANPPKYGGSGGGERNNNFARSAMPKVYTLVST
jgi:hypothetical protein